jgi:transcription termination factor NusB
MSYPLSPADTVDFFRRYYGPTQRAFESLAPVGQAALRAALVELQTEHNIATIPGTTEVAAEFLEVTTIRN